MIHTIKDRIGSFDLGIFSYEKKNSIRLENTNLIRVANMPRTRSHFKKREEKENIEIARIGFKS